MTILTTTVLMSLSNLGDGMRKQRSWRVVDNRRIVGESLAAGASIAEVARHHGLDAHQGKRTRCTGSAPLA